MAERLTMRPLGKPHPLMASRGMIAALLLLLLAAAPAAAQKETHEQIVSAIRADYDAVGAKIGVARKGGEAAKGAGIVLAELVVNRAGHDWPAVGIYKVTYRFWYDWGPDQPFPDRLRKVEVDTVSSARRFYQEYFFDAEGRLRFYYERAGGGPDGGPVGGPKAGSREMRSYFTGDKLVRMVSGDVVNDTPTPGERKTAEVILRSAQRVLATFKTALGLPGK